VGSLIDFGRNKWNNADRANSPAPRIEIREEVVLLEGTEVLNIKISDKKYMKSVLF
jgi:hypothetical protein